MTRTMMCPFFSYFRSEKLHCEAAQIRLPSQMAWDDFVQKYCASLNGWESCPIAKALQEEYERKSKNEKAEY